MDSLLLLIPITLFISLMGLAAFLWALRSGQFDDLDGAANRILFDDDDDLGGPPPTPKTPEPPPKAPEMTASRKTAEGDEP